MKITKDPKQLLNALQAYRIASSVMSLSETKVQNQFCSLEISQNFVFYLTSINMKKSFDSFST